MEIDRVSSQSPDSRLPAVPAARCVDRGAEAVASDATGERVDLALLERLAVLIPRLRINLVLYYGLTSGTIFDFSNPRAWTPGTAPWVEPTRGFSSSLKLL